MAISLRDSPDSWAPRGQKLIFAFESDEIAQSGFKYGIEVTDQLTGKIYNFLYDQDPITGYVYFDLYPLIQLSNEEININPHNMPFESPVNEPQSKGWNDYSVEASEWWVVAGVLAKQSGSEYLVESQGVFNAYYQQDDGYKPDTESGTTRVRFALNSGTQSRAWSDRYPATHRWEYRETFSLGSNNVFIPAFETDYGSIAVQQGLTYLKSNAAAKYSILFVRGDIGSVTFEPLVIKDLDVGSAFQHVGIYPMNLEASTDTNVPRPSVFPDWLYYEIRFLNAANTPQSIRYIIYNAKRLGQHDCRHTYVRLGWVCSRAGWDYANFIKRNEYTTDADRKQFVRGLFSSPTGGNPYFLPQARVWNDRQVISQQYLSIQSDWLQEEEFVLLRSLFVSTQVVIINADGSSTPVSIEDTSFLEKRGRDGKMVNVQMKLKIGHYYWT